MPACSSMNEMSYFVGPSRATLTLIAASPGFSPWHVAVRLPVPAWRTSHL